MRLWHTRIGALVAVIALAVAPAARAGCAARCASPAGVPAAAQAHQMPDAVTAASHQHAHHHDPDAGAASAPASDAAVAETRCAPGDARGCLVIRDASAAPTGRVVSDGVSHAAEVTGAAPLAPGVRRRPAYRTPPIRPPGPTAAFLPLRI